MESGCYRMVDLSNKSALICSNLKKERVLLFNFFDNNQSEMIYTVKNIRGCASILSSEKIDYLIIEYSNELITRADQLLDLIGKYKDIKIALIVNTKTPLQENVYQQLQEHVDIIL